MPTRNSMRRSGGSPALRSTMPVLNLDRAAHGIDHAAELDDAAVARALDDASVVHGDGRIDQAQRPEPRDWECLNHMARAFLRLASIRLMLRKLAIV